MRLTLVTAPPKEPVTLTEMKAHLRVDVADDDALIQSKISAARQYAEQVTRRAFITQTWELALDRAPVEIEVPLPALREVTKIEVVDAAGARAEVPASSYWVELAAGSCGRVRLRDSMTWPAHRGFASFVITFKAGYGDSEMNVPEQIREAIRKHVTIFYENREAVASEMREVDALLFPYKVFRRSPA